MTAIAYRYPYIVADQRITGGGVIMGTDEKIISKLSETKDLYVGMSGDCGLETEVIDYIFQDLVVGEQTEQSVKIKEKLTTPHDKNPQVPTLAVLFDKKINQVSVYYYDQSLYRVKVTAPFFAEGAGFKLCLGAMSAGASAWEAVDAAIEWDPSCGYPVDGYNVTTGQYYYFKNREELKQGPQAPTEPVQHELPFSVRMVPSYGPINSQPLPKPNGAWTVLL